MLQHQRKWFRQDIVTCCTFLLTLFGKWFIIKFRILWKMMYPRMVSKPITKTKILVPVNMWCPKYAHLEVSSLYSKSFSNCSTGWSNIKGVPFMLNNPYDNIINGRGRMNRENSMGMDVHTLGTRLQKNDRGNSPSYVCWPFFTVVMFLYLFSAIKSPSPEIRFWKINFHSTALYLLTLRIAFLPE